MAAGLGKPAAGDADMGDVASQLTNQCSNSRENSGNLPLLSGQRAKCGYFFSVSTFDLVGYRHGR